MLVPANVLVQRRWLRAILEMPLEPETLYVDASQAAVVETKRIEAVLLAARDGGPAETLERLRRCSPGRGCRPIPRVSGP